MKSAATPYLLKEITARALVSVLVAGIIAMVPLYGQSKAPAELGKTKSIAETQHEIVMLLIKHQEFEKALAEANKIFEMKWPDDQEPLLLKELLYLSDQFLRHGQTILGLQVIEGNSKFFRRNLSQIALWKEKGYLYKHMQQDEKALDCFRKAQELENNN